MPIHNLTLVARHDIANQTFSCEFEKPAGFSFKPGQYGGFTLLNPIATDDKGLTRRFTLASTPADPTITIVTRKQTSAFKHSLYEMPLGQVVKFAGPTGNFILHEEPSIPAVFIAGGVGIAPFYSILRHAWQQNSQQKFYLFYGNRSLADTAYYDTFANAATDNQNFQYIPVFEQAHEHWQGQTGYITETLIRQTVADLLQPIYYVCGSPAMVNVMQEMLLEMNIPEENIKVEDFPGY